MAIFESGDVRINYEVRGEGSPILLIAPGGMRSAISFWEHCPWNPIDQLEDDYQVIAMDQRNAGRSTAPVSGDDGWATFTADQLALMDHLGHARFAMAGMCIGGPYILGVAQAAPERLSAAVVFQTIGIDANREAFYDMFDSWADEIRGQHPEASDDDWSRFRESMYGGDDALFTMTDDQVRACQVPILALMGKDLYHPESSSRLLAALAPNATLVEHWIEPAHIPAAQQAVTEFLAVHVS